MVLKPFCWNLNFQQFLPTRLLQSGNYSYLCTRLFRYHDYEAHQSNLLQNYDKYTSKYSPAENFDPTWAELHETIGLFFWISAMKTESSLVRVFWDFLNIQPAFKSTTSLENFKLRIFLRNKFLWFENICKLHCIATLNGSNT